MVQYINLLGLYPIFSIKNNLDIMHKHYIFCFKHFVFNIAREYINGMTFNLVESISNNVRNRKYQGFGNVNIYIGIPHMNTLQRRHNDCLVLSNRLFVKSFV